MATGKAKAIQGNGVIQLSARDQKTIFDALQEENPSVRKYAKLRRAIQRSRKMTGQA